MQTVWKPWTVQYGAWLGYEDASHAEYVRGRTLPRYQGDWKNFPAMEDAYWQALKRGQLAAVQYGLDMRCPVRWDWKISQGPESCPPCHKPATHLWVWDVGFTVHVTPLCSCHAGMKAGNPREGYVLPLSWF